MGRGRSITLVIAMIVIACSLITVVGVLALLHIFAW